MEVITALREAIGTAHEDLEKKREEVEILESKLDYALKENNPEGCQESKLSSPQRTNTLEDSETVLKGENGMYSPKIKEDLVAKLY